MRKEVLSDDIVLYCGDNEALRAEMPRTSAILSDPPYGISYKHGARKGGKRQGTDGQSIVGDDKPFDPSPWLGFAETFLWGAEHFRTRLPEGGRWLVWSKRRVGVVRDQGCVENAWHSVPGVTRLIEHPWDGADMGHERGQPRWHSNQKPIDVMCWCLTFITAEHIIDPYMGSGTTGVACAKTGRPFTGVEIDPGHFDIACKRIEDELRRPRLFAAPVARPTQEAFL